VKVGDNPADGQDVLFPLALLTAAYFASVVWLRRSRRRAEVDASTPPGVTDLPVADQPPPTAVGWPPAGSRFAAYVEDGVAAIDAWLSQGRAA
jgi:hypothetical protein